MALVSTGQSGAAERLPHHELLEPFDDGDTLPVGATRPLPQDLREPSSSRDVRQRMTRTTLITNDQFTEILDKVAGREHVPPHVKKHISGCVDELARRIEKSLKLTAKKVALVDQANALEQGRIPTGVKPYKCSVEVPELDHAIPPELVNLNISFNAGTTFREAKEKLYMASTALAKVMDARVMELQVDSIRKDLSADAFVASANAFSDSRTTAASDLMNELGLGNLVSASTPKLPRAKLLEMYAAVMERVAENRKADEAKREKKEELVAKKVDRLRDTAPHDLLDAKIKQSIAQAMGKKVPLDKQIDYGAAYSMVQAERYDILHESVKPPPGLETQSFRKTSKPKVKEKKEKGKGKGKGSCWQNHKDSSWQNHKGKSKGKGKGKHQESQKGKSNGKGIGLAKGAAGKKGEGSAWKNGNRESKKGKGRGYAKTGSRK